MKKKVFGLQHSNRVLRKKLLKVRILYRRIAALTEEVPDVILSENDGEFSEGDAIAQLG